MSKVTTSAISPKSKTVDNITWPSRAVHLCLALHITQMKSREARGQPSPGKVDSMRVSHKGLAKERGGINDCKQHRAHAVRVRGIDKRMSVSNAGEYEHCKGVH